MQIISHLQTFHTRHTFDLNVRLCEGSGGIVAWSPTQNFALTLRSNDTTQATVDADTLFSFRIDGDRKRIDNADVDRLMQTTGTSNTSETFYDREAGTLYSAIEIVSVTLNGQSYVIAADGAAGAITTYEVTSTGGWTTRETIRDDASSGFSGVSAMATVEMADAAYVVTASASENAISVFGLTEGGALAPVSTLSMADGLPIANPNDVQIVQGAGGTFIIVAAAGSDSLTALKLNAQGGISFTDQIMDSQDTRFDATVAMDWITRDGRIFGAVAGADGGVSVIELLPSGRFIVLSTIEDTTEIGLTGVTDLLLQVTATGLELTTISASEESLSTFAITVSGGIVQVQGGKAEGTNADDLLFGGDGSDSLVGNGGADVLVDGAGVDTMRGGAGSDLFVLDADGEIDRIYDFNTEEDRLDLSAWGMLYSVDQLTIKGRSNGALIYFGDEILHIVSHDGRRLSALDFFDAMILNAQHVTVWEPLSDGPEDVQGLDMTGTAGADTLVGGSGDDTVTALGGDDIIFVTGGDDSIDGGAGRDTLTAQDVQFGVTLQLGAGIAGVEDLIGSGFDDQLTGDSVGNLLDGGAGNDVLNGGGGADTLIGGAGADAFDGGAGIDWVSYADQTADLSADLSGTTPGTGVAAGDTFVFVENLLGGSGNDTLIGNGADNELIGGAGDDLLQGGSGDDTLIGGEGDDVLDGGEGDDLIIAGDVDPAILELFL
ncbi:Bifunctional hemolysin/adenylate cyclase precursor [Rhodobacteraceae bacterium THAF1]|nr:Bifunctional hemolysin/adenylate cyclase precursor [Palleronia sp. THAF1]VDC25723.1 Bifunctional hemolysin/adenylate cyclase precursor [Rhodobacteraceae bacterium THAF1]